MKKAILHIGSEKTGSTSIQQYLHSHVDQLQQKNCHFPYSAGRISNYKLVLFAHAIPDADLLALGGINNDPKSIEEFKQSFFEAHTEEVRQFQKECTEESTIVYSSEHLQSRITRPADITGLKAFLETLYDSIEIVVYLRRQDRFAMSAHNTAIQGGNKSRFDFDAVNVKGPYYDYGSMVKRWSDVFGKKALSVKFFEAERLHRGSVVADFCEHIGVSAEEFREPAKQNNTRLSYSAQETLLAFNRLEDGDKILRGHTKSDIRQDMIKLLHGFNDDHGVIKPSRAQALQFYTHFKKQNNKIAKTWLAGVGFNENFDDYPETADAFPVLDIDGLLDKAISQCVGAVTEQEAALMATQNRQAG